MSWQALLGLMVAMMAVYSPVVGMVQIYGTIRSVIPSLDRVEAIRREPVEVADRPGARPLLDAPRTIELRDVSFAYGTTPVLHIGVGHVPSRRDHRHCRTRRGRANPRSSPCCCASTIRRTAGSTWTASTSATSVRPTSWIGAPSCCKIPSFSWTPSPTTSGWDGRTRRRTRSWRRRGPRTSTTRSWRWRTAMTPCSGSGETPGGSREASASASPSPPHC